MLLAYLLVGLFFLVLAVKLHRFAIRPTHHPFLSVGSLLLLVVSLVLIAFGLPKDSPLRIQFLSQAWLLKGPLAVGITGLFVRWIVGNDEIPQSDAPTERISETQCPEVANLTGDHPTCMDGLGFSVEMPTSNQSPFLVVTLIHGTIHGTFRPEKIKWIFPESDFSTELLKLLPIGVQVKPFRWSGKNTHSARLAGAEELKKHVVDTRNEYPHAQQICVGHSHGGTLIFYALADVEFEKSLSGYAFLSTPFLDFQSRPSNVKPHYLLAAIGLVLVVLPSYSFARLKGWDANLIASCFAIPFAVIVRFFKQRLRYWGPAANRFLASVPKPLYKSEKALYLRTPGDEASNWLSIAYLLNWLQAQSYYITEVFLKQLETKQLQLRGTVRDLLGLIVPIMLLTITAAWAGISTLLCMIVFRLAFGADIAKHSLFVQVSTEPTPTGEWRIAQLRLHMTPIPQSSRLLLPLSHSSYDHPKTPETLNRWIRDLLGGNQGVCKCSITRLTAY